MRWGLLLVLAVGCGGCGGETSDVGQTEAEEPRDRVGSVDGGAPDLKGADAATVDAYAADAPPEVGEDFRCDSGSYGTVDWLPDMLTGECRVRTGWGLRPATTDGATRLHEYTGEEITLTRVDGHEECATDFDYYVTNAADRTLAEIVLCPDTCAAVTFGWEPGRVNGIHISHCAGDRQSPGPAGIANFCAYLAVCAGQANAPCDEEPRGDQCACEADLRAKLNETANAGCALEFEIQWGCLEDSFYSGCMGLRPGCREAKDDLDACMAGG